MSPLETLQQASAQLLQKAKDGSSEELADAVDKATGVLQLSLNHEKTVLEMRTLKLQEDKLQHEIETTASRERDERRKSSVAIWAPMASSLILMGGLLFQTYQYIRSEKTNQERSEHSEKSNQERFEETKWQDAVHNISEASHISAGAIYLRPFLSSPAYSDRARQLSMQLLSTGSDITFFEDVFKAAFVPVTNSNIEDVAKLNRILLRRVDPLYRKVHETSKPEGDLNLLNLNDRKELEYDQAALKVISAQMAVLLTSRDGKLPIDLSTTNLTTTDLRQANFENADLSYSGFASDDVQNADFSHIEKFAGVLFYCTKWWEAKKIAPYLLNYLAGKYPCEPGMSYGIRGDQRCTTIQYQVELARLQAQIP